MKISRWAAVCRHHAHYFFMLKAAWRPDMARWQNILCSCHDFQDCTIVSQSLGVNRAGLCFQQYATPSPDAFHRAHKYKPLSNLLSQGGWRRFQDGHRRLVPAARRSGLPRSGRIGEISATAGAIFGAFGYFIATQGSIAEAGRTRASLRMIMTRNRNVEWRRQLKSKPKFPRLAGRARAHARRGCQSARNGRYRLFHSPTSARPMARRAQSAYISAVTKSAHVSSS